MCTPPKGRIPFWRDNFEEQMVQLYGQWPILRVLYVIGDLKNIVRHSNDGLKDNRGKFDHGRQNQRGEVINFNSVYFWPVNKTKEGV